WHEGRAGATGGGADAARARDPTRDYRTVRPKLRVGRRRSLQAPRTNRVDREQATRLDPDSGRPRGGPRSDDRSAARGDGATTAPAPGSPRGASPPDRAPAQATPGGAEAPERAAGDLSHRRPDARRRASACRKARQRSARVTEAPEPTASRCHFGRARDRSCARSALAQVTRLALDFFDEQDHAVPVAVAVPHGAHEDLAANRLPAAVDGVQCQLQERLGPRSEGVSNR